MELKNINKIETSFNPNNPKFKSTGNTSIKNTGDNFIDLIPSMLNLLSSANQFISTKIIDDKITYNYEPSFFQLPYIVSIIDNVNKNNFTSSNSTQGNIITSIYNIPYTGLNGEKIATFITFYETEKQILEYIIPKDLSYNSPEEAFVYSSTKDGKINCYIVIPKSFYLPALNSGYLVMGFNIYINNNSNNKFNKALLIPGTYETFQCEPCGGPRCNCFI
jgi:hypothetical protein